MDFVNKVAESGIITLDLAPYIPSEDSLLFFDLKPFLFREMILREKDFREAIKQHDWQAYEGKHVAIGCSIDAIIPVWAYMLVAASLNGKAQSIFYGSKEDLQTQIITQNMAALQEADYQDQRVVLKGCGDKEIPASAYVAASARLLPWVKSLMYGEPCSTVPVYKKKQVATAP